MNTLYLVLCVTTLGAVWANAVGQYDWYDANQGPSGSIGSGASGVAGGGGGGSLAQSLSRSPLSSAAAASPQGGDAGSLVSQLLSQASGDDGLTLDIFQNLQRYADSTSPTGPALKDDLLSRILAEAANGVPTHSALSSNAPMTDSAFNQLQAAANVFTVAQGHANDADLALTQAKSDMTSAGSGTIAEAASSAKTVALATIASAKAEARSNVLQSRNAYVSALKKLREKIAVMRVIENRFRQLAVAFSKVREYAGQALVSLKSMTSKKDGHTSNSYHHSPSKEDILTTVASAKARIAKMKAVEKQFLALAQALAKIRVQTYADLRTVRKNAIALAKMTTAAQAQVNAAVESATTIVSQAVATARATALAKAEATANAALAAKSKAETIVNAAAAVVAGARAQVEATAPTSSASGYGSSNTTPNDQQQGTGIGDTPTAGPY